MTWEEIEMIINHTPKEKPVKPRKYQFEQRPGGKGAVVRVGPSGGKKVIAVYTSQFMADQIARALDAQKHLEA
jgi:hypothetical protein